MANDYTIGGGSFGVATDARSGLVTTDSVRTVTGLSFAASKPMGTPKILEALVTRRVVLTMQDSPYEFIAAENEVDTGVVNVTIGCQTHPLPRWRRVGERLIRSQYGEAEAKRLAPSLTLVLDRIEKEFARKR